MLVISARAWAARQEGGSLLTFELPDQQLRHGQCRHGLVAGGSRSKRDHTIHASVYAFRQAEASVQSERAWTIRRTQRESGYERLAECDWLRLKAYCG